MTVIKDDSYLLTTLIRSAEGKCILPRRTYYLKSQVVIENKKNLIIEGNGSEIITDYKNNCDYKESVDAFLIRGCDNLTLQNLTINTSCPSNITVLVEAIDYKENTVTVKAEEEYEITGDEVFMTMRSVSADNAYDCKFHYYNAHPKNNELVSFILNEIYIYSTYSGTSTQYLGDNRFKVFMPESFSLKNCSIGQRISVRHTMYGPSVITLKNTDNTHLKNITMNSTPGMAIVVLTRCENLTIDGLRLEMKKESHNMNSCNTDGIHIVGLTGEFVLKNSYFDGMGDDPLNVHSTAGTITGFISDNKIKCNYCKKKRDGILSADWCRKGDKIRVFNPQNLQIEATFDVLSFSDGVLEYENLQGELKLDYMLHNTAFLPSCLVENVTVKNAGRGLVLQTENVVVKNCEFINIPNRSILMAPAFVQWYEVGPTHNASITDNSFKNCGFDGFAPISVSACHGDVTDKYSNLHSNIIIEGNSIDCKNSVAIEACAVNGICVRNNKIISKNNTDTIRFIACSNITNSQNH